MPLRRIAAVIGAISTSLFIVLGVAGPANAATPEEKLQVMSDWTQPTQSSYDAWNAARNDQGPWADYGFDWSTDYCSNSPDNPFGFPFEDSCAHHDWGYRNYKAMGQFDANKSRIDDMFYFNMQQVCAGYSGWEQDACDGTAWSYYHAVVIFGIQSRSTGQALQMAAAAH